ncbi:unnamed protein product, partial [Candidula unifasciata]
MKTSNDLRHGPNRQLSPLDRTTHQHKNIKHNMQQIDRSEEFDKWRRCVKCHQPLVKPKALPCLHTICLHCLRIHYQTVRAQISLQAEQKPEKYNFFAWEGCFPCPVCLYPCYTLNGELESFPTNTWLLRLTYRERLRWLKENRQSSTSTSVAQQEMAHRANVAVSNPRTAQNVDLTQDSSEIVYNKDLQSHLDHVTRECQGRDSILLTNEDQPTTGNTNAEKLYQYDLRHGEDVLEMRHPNAIAVSTHTGHVVVVDTTWNKAVLYKTHRKPFSYKAFHHPIIDVCFCPPSKKDRTERFCAMGRRADVKGIMVYTAPFDKDPNNFKCTYQKNIRDVSGLLVIDPDILFMSLCYANTVIRQVNASQFVDLATHSHHGIYYPTHLTHTVVGEVVVSDTGNHRIGVFYGPEYLAYDFYGQFGSEYGNFFYPFGVAADNSRHLYICDSNNYRVQVFDRYFRFQSCAIEKTYLMGQSVSQDVKPIDCAVNSRQHLVVLFRGRAFMSLQ